MNCVTLVLYLSSGSRKADGFILAKVLSMGRSRPLKASGGLSIVPELPIRCGEACWNRPFVTSPPIYIDAKAAAYHSEKIMSVEGSFTEADMLSAENRLRKLSGSAGCRPARSRKTITFASRPEPALPGIEARFIKVNRPALRASLHCVARYSASPAGPRGIRILNLRAEVLLLMREEGKSHRSSAVSDLVTS